MLAKSFAFDELRGDKVHRVDLFDFMNGDDVWMIQRGSSLGFLNKATHARLIGSNIGGQDLQSHSAIEFCVLREIDLTHSAFTDFRADFVAA